MRRLVLVLVSFLIGSLQLTGATYYSRTNGDWNSASTWSAVACGGAASAVVPGPGDVVNICAHTVNVTGNTSVSSVTIMAGGTLRTGTTGGGANKTVTITGTFTIQSGGTYIHNNHQSASSTVFAGTEFFDNNSTITITDWSDVQDSLVDGVSSNFGNLNLNWDTGIFLWNNGGLGSVRTINGNLTTYLNCGIFFGISSSDISVSIGGNLTVGDEIRIKTSYPGNGSLTVGGTIYILTSNSFLFGVYEANGNFSLNTSNFSISSGLFYGVYNGDGNLSFTSTSTYTQNGGTFTGIRNTVTYTAGVPTYIFNTINFSNGAFIGNSSCNTANGITQFIVLNSLNIAFIDPSNVFSINRLAMLSSTASTIGLNMLVGSMTVNGPADGEFNSSNGTGAEIINITGALNISKGKVYFNVVPGFGSNGHTTNISMGSSTITGGTLYLSSETGPLTCSVSGNFSLVGGTVTAKAKTSAATLSLNTFNQSGGTFYLYNNTTLASPDVVSVTVNGNFTQSNGTINFSNNTLAGNATNVITVKGGSYIIGVAGTMTRGGAYTGSQFGSLVFNAAGTTTYSRSGGHSVQQVKQTVGNGTTLNVSSNIQVASNVAAGTDYFTIASGGTVTLSTYQIYSDAAAANSGITVIDGGRLRIQNQNGLYNNSTLAAISNAGNMNFSLGANSVIEYYGTATQVLSGINTGLATGTQHKYGILDINFNGPTGSAWVYPTSIPSATNAIYIRTELRLTKGELNLTNNASVAASGGRTVTIENGATSAITRTNGYIRGECQDFSAIVKWKIGSGSGNYVFPFGYDASNYIPVTLSTTGGITGDASVSTYNTPATNLPWPPGVTNLISAIGLSPDNRTATTDRFWFTSFTGTPSTSLTLTYTSSEIPLSPYNNTSALQAHRFNTASSIWEVPLPGQLTGVNSISIPAIPPSGIWATASNMSPLPIELLAFSAEPDERNVVLKWSTASEKGNDYFTVQRTIDFKTIKSFDRINGAHNSVTVLHYSMIDEDPENGLSYYRLLQTDIDGTTTGTNWVAVNFNSAFEIFPNPASDFVFIKGAADQKILATHISGTTTELNVENEKVDISRLIPGCYMLQLPTEKKVVSRPLIVSGR